MAKIDCMKVPRRTAILLMAGMVIIGAAVVFRSELRSLFNLRPTVENRMAMYGAPARARLASIFAARHIQYPPQKVSFIAIKASNELHVYCSEPESEQFRFVCTYPILGASGHLGPKLREGDLQVPEGIYQLSLEPNTPYHLALRLNYPNETDIARARADGRENPGSNILIHGTTGSIGCLAMGDQASEDLFVLAHDARDSNIELIIAPVDLRIESAPAPQQTDPAWLPQLYSEIKNAMVRFPSPAR